LPLNAPAWMPLNFQTLCYTGAQIQPGCDTHRQSLPYQD
ncbi:uncharacterized protein METZ01_LOCUS440951, partial [marine metagenome]